MSASLVGSEMCIRDSQSEPMMDVCDRRSAPLRNPQESSGQLLGALWTVSYTHLTLPTICSV
eukprot:11299185-Alexandrium_andersonii.AAC.1